MSVRWVIRGLFVVVFVLLVYSIVANQGAGNPGIAP